MVTTLISQQEHAHELSVLAAKAALQKVGRKLKDDSSIAAEASGGTGALHGNHSPRATVRNRKQQGGVSPRSMSVTPKSSAMAMKNDTLIGKASMSITNSPVKASSPRRAAQASQGSTPKASAQQAWTGMPSPSVYSLAAASKVKWTLKEVESLKKGLARYGVGNWNEMLKDPQLEFHPKRDSVNLKDKYRNLNVANYSSNVQNNIFKVGFRVLAILDVATVLLPGAGDLEGLEEGSLNLPKGMNMRSTAVFTVLTNICSHPIGWVPEQRQLRYWEMLLGKYCQSPKDPCLYLFPKPFNGAESFEAKVDICKRLLQSYENERMAGVFAGPLLRDLFITPHFKRPVFDQKPTRMIFSSLPTVEKKPSTPRSNAAADKTSPALFSQVEAAASSPRHKAQVAASEIGASVIIAKSEKITSTPPSRIPDVVAQRIHHSRIRDIEGEPNTKKHKRAPSPLRDRRSPMASRSNIARQELATTTTSNGDIDLADFLLGQPKVSEKMRESLGEVAEIIRDLKTPLKTRGSKALQKHEKEKKKRREKKDVQGASPSAQSSPKNLKKSPNGHGSPSKHVPSPLKPSKHSDSPLKHAVRHVSTKAGNIDEAELSEKQKKVLEYVRQSRALARGDNMRKPFDDASSQANPNCSIM